MMKTIGPEAVFCTDISELAASVGQTVTVCGTVHKIRRMSDFAFVLLRVRSGLLQCVYTAETAHFPIGMLSENMSLSVFGTVCAEKRSHEGFELQMQEIQILSAPAETSPIVISNRELHTSLETLLDYRPLTLRNSRERAIFKIQSELCKGIRAHLDKNGFTEIHTPKLGTGSAEGGANVFRLDYFGKEAFLAQSPQFYKQAMVAVFERVYEIAPVFRAEKHDTSRHINEYTSIDLEMAFIQNYEDLMRFETDMLSYAFTHLRESCPEELAILHASVPNLTEIPVVPFDEAKKMIASTFHRASAEDSDFDPEEEKLLCELIQRQTGSDLVFVTGYRSSKRPFYTMDNRGNPAVTKSFDLLFRGMEVTTGGQRIHSYSEQITKMESRGMNPLDFEGYLMAHRYGLPPHGGMGIGLERLTAKLLNFDNVRRATLFPRDIRRLTP